MKIGWVTNNLAPYRWQLWSELSKLYQVEIAPLESEKSLLRHGVRSQDWIGALRDDVPVRRFKTWTFYLGEAPFHVLLSSSIRWVKSLDAIALGGWESPANWSFLLYAKIFRIPVITFYESHSASHRFSDGPVAHLRRAYFNWSDSVVVPGVSAFAAVESFLKDPSKIFLGFNSVDFGPFLKANLDSALEKRDESFIYVGQLIDRKNVESLIKAFSKIRKVGECLTIVGKGHKEQQLKNLAEDLALGHSVSFVGDATYDSVPGHMAAARVLVLPSSQEVWGLVANEALAAGCAVVVSEKAGVAASISRMSKVYICSVDVNSIAKQMRKAMDEWIFSSKPHEIAEFDSAAFAHVFHRAIESAAILKNK